ncbi:hypothetical protein KQH51_03410 [bacterium]|nr:hypothetical protein [bacterium]MCB2201970.1 hypothetical protein [bacterium]
MITTPKTVNSILWLLLALSLFATGAGHAQPELEPVEEITDYRPIGSLRMWTFTHQAKDMGRLFSTVTREDEVGGEDVLVIERRFSISYALVGSDATASVQGESYITPLGFYRGDNITLTNDSLTERLSMTYESGSLSGFFTRGGNQVDRTVSLESDMYPWDFNLVDQLEMFLARHRIAVGESIYDTLYQPQSMSTIPISGLVSDFEYKQLYKGKFDSVFVIHLSAPQQIDCFFTRDRRLARVDFLPQRIRVYLDLVTQTEALKAKAGQRSWTFDSSQIPHWILYLIVGGLGVLFFARTKPSWTQIGLAAALGVALFAISLVTQIPLQEWLVRTFLGQGGPDEQWSYGGALLPALAGGVVQGLLLAGGVGVLVRWFRPDSRTRVTLAAVVGAVFGLFEACLRLGYFSDELFGWSLLERGFMIVFLAASTALIGAWWTKKREQLLAVVVLVMLVNSALRYVPIFAQRGVLDPELVNLLIAAAVVVFVLMALLVMKRGQFDD